MDLNRYHVVGVRPKRAITWEVTLVQIGPVPLEEVVHRDSVVRALPRQQVAHEVDVRLQFRPLVQAGTEQEKNAIEVRGFDVVALPRLKQFVNQGT